MCRVSTNRPTLASPSLRRPRSCSPQGADRSAKKQKCDPPVPHARAPTHVVSSATLHCPAFRDAPVGACHTSHSADPLFLPFGRPQVGWKTRDDRTLRTSRPSSPTLRGTSAGPHGLALSLRVTLASVRARCLHESARGSVCSLSRVALVFFTSHP